MKLFILIFCFISLQLFGQEKEPIPRFVKTKILNSSSYAYLPNANAEINVSYSEDSSAIYTYEELIGNFTFSFIHVDFMHEINDSLEQQQVLVSYLEYLKTQLEIEGSAGYGYGHTLESQPNTQGIIDYWMGKENTKYALKAWTNSKHITIFFLYGTEEYPYFNAQQMYFDGIRY
jgi:hypothetical protein